MKGTEGEIFMRKRKKNFIGVVLLLVLLNAVTVVASVNIPSEAKKWNENKHFYYVYPHGTCSSYEEAIEFCKKMGGHMATIESKEENDFLYNYVVDAGYGMAYFGLHRDNGWKWADDSKVGYLNWNVGEPGSYEKYARFKDNYGGVWVDDTWGNFDNTAFICEWDSKLTVSNSTVNMSVGDSFIIQYSVTDGKGSTEKAKATWKTSNKDIVKVSSKGQLIALNPGTCIITCKVGIMSKKISVIVKPQKVSGLKTLSKNKTSLQIGWKKQTGVTKYQIYEYDTDFKEYTKVKTVKGNYNSVIIDKLKKNTIYCFKIRGYVEYKGKKYYGPFSKEYKVKTLQ